MRIAIAISGYARTLHHCLPSFVQKVVQSNSTSEIEVFCCLWETSLGRVEKLNDPWHYKVEALQRDSLESSEELRAFIEGNCNVKAHIKLINSAQSQVVINEGKSLGMQYPELLSQYYMISESYEMTRKYSPDYCIRARPDMKIDNFPSLENRSEFILSEYVWYDYRAKDGHENEMIWVSSSRIAEKTFSAIRDIRSGSLLSGPQHGEAITGRHFERISATKERFNFSYRIAR